MLSKLLKLTAFITLFSVSSVNADDCFWSESQSVPSYCCETECKAQRYLAISGDILYWRALQNGLDDCFCGNEIKNQWDLGFRIGLELSPKCEGWDIGAFWTQYKNKSDRGFREADHFSRWKLDYDTIDLLFGYRIVKNDFNYTPYVALRGARIDEKLNALFSACTCEDIPSDSITALNHREKFTGIGPKIGVKGEYTIGCDFGIYADLGVGLLYGKFKLRERDFQAILDPTDNGAFCSNRHIDACQAVVDAAVGIQWKLIFCNGNAFFLKIGLEHHRYFNQTRLGSYGDLCLDGATVSAGVEF